MANRTSPVQDAIHQGAWVRMTVGRELRIGRVTAGKTQREVGNAVGRSASNISRVERGAVAKVSVVDLMAIAAAVGLRLWVRVVPGGRRTLDAAQLALIEAFNRRLHASWKRELEAVVPIAGDLRAADELIRNDACSCTVEAITRIADLQGQLRPAKAKQRDLQADRLILLVKGSHANRRILHEAGPMVRQAFPIATRDALSALGDGEDPGGDCLIVM